jgi:hypothetical protein
VHEEFNSFLCEVRVKNFVLVLEIKDLAQTFWHWLLSLATTQSVAGRCVHLDEQLTKKCLDEIRRHEQSFEMITSSDAYFRILFLFMLLYLDVNDSQFDYQT